MVLKSSSSLAPGFRFHPTDEELVRYYLRRKIIGKPFFGGAISDVDIYKAEPWDLPAKSALQSRDLEWYFFSGLDKKYGNGDRTNRATDQGYWKTTGKDRPVYHKCQVVGMKKTLVYHNGRAPKGQRTNWVMHEYRLIDEDMEKTGFSQDAFVLCRVFQKSGSGPKNGEQYGAPFVEEEWEGCELGMAPKLEVVEEVEGGNDDACLDGLDLQQILAAGIPDDDALIGLDYYCGENGSSGEETADPGVGELNGCELQSDDHKLFELPAPSDMHQVLVNDSQASIGKYEYHNVSEQSEDQKPHISSDAYSMHQNPVRNEYYTEPIKTLNPVDSDYTLGQPYVDALDDLQFGDGAFLEANDLSTPIFDATGAGLMDEYIFFDANDEYLNFDNLEMVGDDLAPVSGQAIISQMDVRNGTNVMPNQQLPGNSDDNASSSKPQLTKDHSQDFQYPFLKKARCMLESIHAPPAYASEFPSKEAALRLYSPSSSSAHITAGMIEIGDIGLGRHGMDWLSGKNGRYNIVLSFGVSRGVDNSTTLESVVRIDAGKNASGLFRGWFCFMFFWVLILTMSFKIGSFVCAR